MNKFARIEGDKVAEIIEIEGDSLDGLFHPDVVAAFVAVPDGVAVEEGGVKDGDVFLPKEEPTVPPLRSIAPLAFRRRMTMERRIAITTAAQSNAAIRTFLDDQLAARVIDLDHSDTLAGIAALVAAKLLSAGEEAALLADGQPGEG